MIFQIFYLCWDKHGKHTAMLSPVPTFYTNVLCGVLLTLCKCIKYQPFLCQIYLQIFLEPLSHAGAKLSLTVPLALKFDVSHRFFKILHKRLSHLGNNKKATTKVFKIYFNNCVFILTVGLNLTPNIKTVVKSEHNRTVKAI